MVVSTIYCHACSSNVRIKIDEFQTGNLTMPCPVCEHNHHRYVEKGVITDDRWKSRGSATVIWSYTSSTSSFDSITTTTAGSKDVFLADSWNNSDSTG